MEIKNNSNTKLTSNDCYSELLFKVLFVGDFGVGKTSIIRRFTDGTFTNNYKITIGADFAVKTFFRNGTQIHLQLWDIAGHERFGCLTNVYYRYAVAAVIVFDLTRPETFQSTEKWLRDIREKVKLKNLSDIPLVLLANKGDITTNLPQHISDFCKTNGILHWFITSAKDNANIDEAMNCILERVIQNQASCGDVNDLPSTEYVDLGNENQPPKKSCCM